MKRYKMRLPNTDLETFIYYTKRLINSKRFPHLSFGALDYSANKGLPNYVYPYLHWEDEGDSYIYFGHKPDFLDVSWIDFALDKTSLGEL